jgi:hypothetical protein
MLRLDRINRLELIGNVRQVLWVSNPGKPKRLAASLQDDGRTLKLFLIDSDDSHSDLYPPKTVPQIESD